MSGAYLTMQLDQYSDRLLLMESQLFLYEMMPEDLKNEISANLIGAATGLKTHYNELLEATNVFESKTINGK
jgi:hypothetical protein